MSTTETAAQEKARKWLERSLFARMASRRLFARRRKFDPEPVLSTVYYYPVSFFTGEALRWDVLDWGMDSEMLQARPPTFERSAELARAVRSAAPALAFNTGIRLLCDGVRAEGWDALTFVSRRGADGYYEWVLQLSARGLPIPL